MEVTEFKETLSPNLYFSKRDKSGQYVRLEDAQYEIRQTAFKLAKYIVANTDVTEQEVNYSMVNQFLESIKDKE